MANNLLDPSLQGCPCGSDEVAKLVLVQRRWCLDCGREWASRTFGGLPEFDPMLRDDPASIEGLFQACKAQCFQAGVILSRGEFLKQPILTTITPEMVICVMAAGFKLSVVRTPTATPDASSRVKLS